MVLKKNSDKEQLGRLKKSCIDILLIEDNKFDAHLTKSILKECMSYPYRIRHVKNMAEAESILNVYEDLDIVLLDLGLPDTEDAHDTFKRVEHIKEKIPVVILTGQNDHAAAISFLDDGAEDYIRKSVVTRSPELLSNAIDFAICRHNNLAILKDQNATELKEKDMVINWLSGNYSIES